MVRTVSFIMKTPLEQIARDRDTQTINKEIKAKDKVENPPNNQGHIIKDKTIKKLN